MAAEFAAAQDSSHPLNFELTQRFYFEAAHTLNRGFDTAASRRIHGHTYHAEVTISGVPAASSGMICDLAELRAYIESVRACLDHQLLDDVADLGPPTLENLCRFIWRQLSHSCRGLAVVSVERSASGDRCLLRRA
jgi:6-pyruvoyltetrahydropterin/6-carboxytetrahydropterin synthase